MDPGARLSSINDLNLQHLYVSASLSAYYKATRASVARSSAIIVCTDLGNASNDYLQEFYCPADLIKI